MWIRIDGGGLKLQGSDFIVGDSGVTGQGFGVTGEG